MSVGLELSPVMLLILFLSFFWGIFFYGNADSSFMDEGNNNPQRDSKKA